MELRPTHELHKRRQSRNLGVALALVAFVALLYGLTLVKVSRGAKLQGFDHTVRSELTTNEVTQ